MAFSPFFDLVKYSKYCCPVNNYSPLLADATANALLFIYLCVASLVYANGILRAYFHTNTTCHAAVLLVNRFILSHVVIVYKYLIYKKILRILQLTSVRLPFPGFLPEIQKRQPRKEGIREAPFLCPHL